MESFKELSHKSAIKFTPGCNTHGRKGHTVPIFMPIAMEIGFDPLCFSLLMCVNLQTSFLTPPFGYALFYFKGVAPEGFSMMHIYKGIMPFVLLQVLSLLILCLFPGIVTWLPGIFFGAQ